jgi:hypothetical protein
MTMKTNVNSTMTNLRKQIAIIFSVLILLGCTSLTYEGDIKWNGWSYHDVVTDANGGILPWHDPAHLGRSYDHVLDLVWNYWNNLPTMPNGYKYYVQFRIANAPDHEKGADEGGLGGDQIGMAMNSWRLYYAYTGDPELIADMKYMADTYLDLGLSPANFSWPNITYPCNINAGIEPGEAETSGTGPLIYNGDTRSGVGITQPDKAGSFAYEMVMLYEMTGETKYLEAAKKMAATLASKVKPGDSENAPLPFKVNAETGEIVSPYTSNWVSTIKLFDELTRLGEGNYSDEVTTFKDFLKNTVIPNHKYGPFFEDIIGYSETSINAVTLAMYILQQGVDWGPDWQEDTKNILAFCKEKFSIEKQAYRKNRYGVEYKAAEYKKLYKVIPIAEQTAYMIAGNSHTSRYASIVLMYGDKTGDFSDEAMAIKQLSWATYMVKSNGQNCYPQDGVWLTDSYGDYVRHYLRSMGANPELAPDNSNHLLKTTSVVSDISYSKKSIEYSTFDKESSDVFRLVSKPKSVSVDGNKLKSGDYSWRKLDTGGVLTLSSDKGRERIIRL